MNQLVLKLLLEKASDSECSSELRNAIHCTLERSVDPKGVLEAEERRVLKTLLGKFFVETCRARPDLLPSLFPVFAMICGERARNKIFADINWSSIDDVDQEV